MKRGSMSASALMAGIKRMNAGMKDSAVKVKPMLKRTYSKKKTNRLADKGNVPRNY